MPSNFPITPIRMDEELTLKIRHIAKLEDRSVNKQINAIVKSFVKDYESKNGEIKVNTDDLYS